MIIILCDYYYYFLPDVITCTQSREESISTAADRQTAAVDFLFPAQLFVLLSPTFLKVAFCGGLIRCFLLIADSDF